MRDGPREEARREFPPVGDSSSLQVSVDSEWLKKSTQTEKGEGGKGSHVDDKTIMLPLLYALRLLATGRS